MKKKENKLNVVGENERVEVVDRIMMEWVYKALVVWFKSYLTRSKRMNFTQARPERIKVY